MMKYEIKDRYTDNSIFSLETDSLKLCVEAAVKQGISLMSADLAGADLTGADLTYVNLAGANLTRADLTGADLTDADLTCVNLAGANLTGVNLAGADLTGADLTDATGMNKNLITPLRILLEQVGPIRAYKLVDASGKGPFKGGINYLNPHQDEFIVLRHNRDENEQCGAGINLATLNWVMKEWRPGYRILIMEFFANEPKGNLVVPTATDGKFRVKQCRRVGEKDLVELGLVEK